MINVMTIVGNRPELITRSEVMTELDQYTEHLLLHKSKALREPMGKAEYPINIINSSC
jgi:UDP-N-acetylglucosamine 2-epimerase